MSSKQQIKEAIARMATIGGGMIPVESGTVRSLDEAAQTCEVEVSGLSYFDVQLRAGEPAELGVLLLPKIGSTVLVAELEGVPEMRYVAQFSEIESAWLIIDGVKVEVDSSTVKVSNGQSTVEVSSDKVSIVAGGTVEVQQAGIKLAANGQNLLSILTSLITALETLTVTNSAGPSGPPNNIAAITALRPRVQALLNS